MSCTLKEEKERFASALLAESCENDTYRQETLRFITRRE
jgi:hypothetical protein